MGVGDCAGFVGNTQAHTTFETANDGRDGVMRQLARVATFGCACIAIALLLGCSTPLLNLHTLDLAATVDDVAVRQVIFNLAKVAENKYALPSQVQIPSGQVSARTSVTPTVTAPLNNVFTSTSQVASQVVAASGALTTTTTNIGANQRIDSTAGVSGVMEDLENWNVDPVQDPEQLRRLQLLYQYGAGQISAQDVLCLYPIPEFPEKSAANKSDLQSLADAIRRAEEKQELTTPDGDKQHGKKPNADKPDADNPDTAPPARKALYIRGEFPNSCFNVAVQPGAKRVKWMFVGPNPDAAFLKPPGCVLCAFPNKLFQTRLKTGDPIYPDRYSDVDVKLADPSKYQYVPVALNDFLIPGKTDEYDYRRRQGPIDWLFVLRDGIDPPPPENARRVGSSHGYTVYTTDDQKFSEFVLAVIEATLQPHEIEKQGATAPPVVQTNPH